jgi:hypothetical protein
MSRSTDPLKSFLVALALAATLATGCRNPFNPSSDIELATFSAVNYSDEIIIYPSQISGGNGTLPIDNWVADAVFVIKNKVAATITSVNIVYTDSNGNQVTAYKATGGKTFKTTLRLHPMNDDNNAGGFGYQNGYGEGEGTVMQVYMVDRQVINEITAPSYPANKFMFAIITFRGEDDNGYDFKLTAKIGIKYFF